MPGLISFPGMIASHYTVHSMEETKTRHANTKFFLPRDIACRKNIESIRSYSTFAKEKISVPWQLLMPFLVKRTMLFALKSISTPELSTAAYSTLKLCRYVDLLDMKATYHFSLVIIPSMRKVKRAPSFPPKDFLHDVALKRQADWVPRLCSLISDYFFGLDYVLRWILLGIQLLFTRLHAVNDFRGSRAN